jgi:hypothetical protein
MIGRLSLYRFGKGYSPRSVLSQRQQLAGALNAGQQALQEILAWWTGKPVPYRRKKRSNALALELDEEDRQSNARPRARADAERWADRGKHRRLSQSRIFVNASKSVAAGSSGQPARLDIFQIDVTITKIVVLLTEPSLYGAR